MDVGMKKGNEAILIELCGLAGSGKSTTFNSLKIKRENLQFGYPISISRHALFMLLAVICTAKIFIFSGFQGRFWKRYKCIIWLKTMEIALRNRQEVVSKNIIVEQGPIFLQAFLLGFGSNWAPKKCLRLWVDRSLLNWARYFKSVIYLNLSNDMIISRVRTRRKDHRLKDKSDKELQDFIEAYREVYAKILTVYEKSGVEVLKIDSGLCSIEEVAEKSCCIIDS